MGNIDPELQEEETRMRLAIISLSVMIMIMMTMREAGGKPKTFLIETADHENQEPTTVLPEKRRNGKWDDIYNAKPIPWHLNNRIEDAAGTFFKRRAGVNEQQEKYNRRRSGLDKPRSEYNRRRSGLDKPRSEYNRRRSGLDEDY